MALGRCPQCGAPLDNGQCTYCSYREPVQAPSMQGMPQVVINNSNTMVNGAGPSYRQKHVAFLLCLFLGIFGVHRFYTGRFITGLIYLFTLGLFGFGVVFDLIIIGVGRYMDSDGNYLV